MYTMITSFIFLFIVSSLEICHIKCDKLDEDNHLDERGSNETMRSPYLNYSYAPEYNLYLNDPNMIGKTNNSISARMFQIKRLKQEPIEQTIDVMQQKYAPEGGIYWIGWRWNEITLRNLWLFSIFLLIAGLIKLRYHHSYFLTNTIPESCILILFGLAFGTGVNIFSIEGQIPSFTVNLFFFGLLPPLILESAYTLHDTMFFSNLGTILLYAIFGTLISMLTVGMSLYLVIKMQIQWLSFPNVTFVELMAFSTAISAVDPVSVLSIFQDLRVNKTLYFLVFGESLFNDAVVIVLHRLISTFIKAEVINAQDILNGLISFLFVSVGGFIIGCLFGIATAYITKTTKKIEVIEPLIVFSMAYLSFLTAEVIHWSGLISLIGCGLVQAEYSFFNITPKSLTTVRHTTNTLTSVSDLLTFFFLGCSFIEIKPVWSTSFSILTIVFCLISRFIGVFLLSYIANNYFHRVRIINLEEQIVMAYGGLRGAVAFAIIAILHQEENVKQIDLFRTTTLFVIFVTVFLVGGTTKHILSLLKIKREEKVKGAFKAFNDLLMETIVLGIEDVAGTQSIWYRLFHSFSRLNEEKIYKKLKNPVNKETNENNTDKKQTDKEQPDVQETNIQEYGVQRSDVQQPDIEQPDDEHDIHEIV